MVKPITHAFMITSAINTKFGVFNAEQRLQQTIDTIKSIWKRVPAPHVFLIETGAVPLTQEQRDTLTPMVDKIIDFNDDQDVKDIYLSENWDLVKNTTEVMCFRRALAQLSEEGAFDKVDRIHKISGRYTLSDNFDLKRYEQFPDKIITTQKYASQFPLAITQVTNQYMSRLWSWPADMTDEIIDVYDNGLDYIAGRIAAGGYCDIEHMLFKFLPQEHIHECEKVGVTGNIGPNGAAIDD
jgi:hypothetical protein